MTIYAIVNDLVAKEPPSGSTGPIWTLISPASILQGGNPYFVPDFASRFEARLALAVRIGKLGKGIAPRFAPRYVDAVAPAVVFVAADRLNRLRDDLLPWTSALSYDRSLAIGRFKAMEYDSIAGCECSFITESADTYDERITVPAILNHSLSTILETVSRDNTLKTGDLVLTGLSGSGQEVSPGMKAQLRLNGEDSLRFNIR